MLCTWDDGTTPDHAVIIYTQWLIDMDADKVLHADMAAAHPVRGISAIACPTRPTPCHRASFEGPISSHPSRQHYSHASIGGCQWACCAAYVCTHAWVGGRNILATLGNDAFPAVKATHRSFCLHHSIILPQSVYCQPIHRAFTDTCHSREGDIQLLHMIDMV